MLTHFSGRILWVDLAGASGAFLEEDDGLVTFKRGWSTGTRPAHLCERILQPEIYVTLAREAPRLKEPYFPAYRAGEFA
jgi:hypothetical protein